MLARKIPSTGESIPAVGLGTWQTFDSSSLDEEHLRPLQDVLQMFFDHGGRVVDSSPMYGKAEEVTGNLSTKLKINDKRVEIHQESIEGEHSPRRVFTFRLPYVPR